MAVSGGRTVRWALVLAVSGGLLAAQLFPVAAQKARAQVEAPSTGGDNVFVAESDSGTVPATVVIALSVAMDKAASVDFATADGTATAGQDYIPMSGTVVFRPGETRKTVTVRVIGDRIAEGDETFTVNTAGSRAVVTIIDDDPSISVAGTTVMEGDFGLHNTSVLVTLTVPASNRCDPNQVIPGCTPSGGRNTEPVDVSFETVDGTALAGQDYIPVSGTLTLPAGATSANVLVPIIGDTTPERDETFFVRLFNPSRGEITGASAGVTILNDDAVALTGELPVPSQQPGGPVPPGALPSSVSGLRSFTSTGQVAAFGNTAVLSPAEGIRSNKPFVGGASSPSRNGYWLVATDGGVFAFGDAQFFGSTSAIKLNQPIIGMAATPTGNGYWLVATDGGIFTFGDAQFFGSTGAIKLTQPIVGMAATPTGNGYWLVATDGGIFAFGDAPFLGSTAGLTTHTPVVGMAATPTGQGYWLATSHGGVFAFGDAGFFGSMGGIALNKPIAAIAATRTGNGYWLFGADGGLFAFGDAPFAPRRDSVPLTGPVVGIAA